jgi:hypothetical protein
MENAGGGGGGRAFQRRQRFNEKRTRGGAQGICTHARAATSSVVWSIRSHEQNALVARLPASPSFSTHHIQQGRRLGCSIVSQAGAVCLAGTGDRRRYYYIRTIRVESNTHSGSHTTAAIWDPHKQPQPPILRRSDCHIWVGAEGLYSRLFVATAAEASCFSYLAFRTERRKTNNLRFRTRR